jgi:hypothetical protein
MGGASSTSRASASVNDSTSSPTTRIRASRAASAALLGTEAVISGSSNVVGGGGGGGSGGGGGGSGGGSGGGGGNSLLHQEVGSGVIPSTSAQNLSRGNNSLVVGGSSGGGSNSSGGVGSALGTPTDSSVVVRTTRRSTSSAEEPRGRVTLNARTGSISRAPTILEARLNEVDSALGVRGSNTIGGGSISGSTSSGLGSEVGGDRWSRVKIEHDLFNDEFLNAIDMPAAEIGTNGGSDGSGTMLPDGSNVAGSGNSNSSRGGGNLGGFSNVSCKPISLWLADVDSSQIISHAHSQMSQAVSNQCRQSDRFTARLQRQIYALQLIHRSMGTIWESTKRKRTKTLLTSSSTSSPTSLLSSNMSSSGSATATATAAASPSSSLTNTAKRGMASLPPSAHLGLFMFHTLLDCVNEPTSDMKPQQELLHSIVPMIRDLSAMSVSGERINPWSRKGSLGKEHSYVLDALRNFLLR